MQPFDWLNLRQMLSAFSTCVHMIHCWNMIYNHVIIRNIYISLLLSCYRCSNTYHILPATTTDQLTEEFRVSTKEYLLGWSWNYPNHFNDHSPKSASPHITDLASYLALGVHQCVPDTLSPCWVYETNHRFTLVSGTRCTSVCTRCFFSMLGIWD